VGFEEKLLKFKLGCPVTKKEEAQVILKESEDGVMLKCKGCGKVHSHEIGEIYG